MYKPLPMDHPDHAVLKALELALIAAAGGEEAFDKKMKAFFRSAIDEVIDSGRTGRLFIAELEKTEKTYLGTKFEKNLRDWLEVERGETLDLKIGGLEVDIKSSVSGWNWGIPQEAFNQFCILINVDDIKHRYSLGLFLASVDRLSTSKNRDTKRRIPAKFRKEHVWWLRFEADYTPNFWSRIAVPDREEIMRLLGTKALSILFERYQGVPVSRVQIAAIARQDDFMKRVRRNGGARDNLAPKGIAVLYEGKDRNLLKSLGINVGKREFISFRPRNDSERVLLRALGHID